jgi:hypothetical protein
VLRRSRRKTSLALLGSLALVVIGLFMIVGEPSASSRYSPEVVRLIGWISIIFFGWTGLVAVRNLIRPIELILTPDGFSVKGGWKKRAVAWRDVRRFFVAEVRRSKFVCYELNREPTEFQRAMGLSSTGHWGDGQIPAHLEDHPDDVVELLEDWRRRYMA